MKVNLMCICCNKKSTVIIQDQVYKSFLRHEKNIPLNLPDDKLTMLKTGMCETCLGELEAMLTNY